jgi:predicted AAA+ superfamily ATPase
MTIKNLIELNDLALRQGRRYPDRRDSFHQLEQDAGRHFTGIVGPRGAGKTVLLQQCAAATPDAFYLSADTLDADEDGFDVIKRLADQFGYRTFYLDEVHHFPNASGILKKIYDFLDVRIIFTSSVALAMEASRHDLARRVRFVNMSFFSYREYLRMVHHVSVPPLSFGDLLTGSWQAGHVRAGAYFDAYVKGGNMPFALEEPDPLVLLGNIRDKIIDRDIPHVVRLMVDELEILRKMLRFIGRSTVDGVNYSSLSRNLGITKYKASQYADCLEKAFVLRQVFPAGTNVLREPKILLTPPYRLLYRDYQDALGGLREDFCVAALLQADFFPAYLKSTRGAKTPDFLIQWEGLDVAVEIGGPGKGREQFKGIQADRKLVFAHIDAPEKGRIPLFMLGLLGR